MQPFVAGTLLGLALGAVLGPRLLRRARTLPLARPSRTEVWLTSFVFALCLLDVPRWSERLSLDPAAVSVLTGAGCVGLLLCSSAPRASRWPFPIRMMHVLAGVVLLLQFGKAVFPLLVPWLATPAPMRL